MWKRLRDAVFLLTLVSSTWEILKQFKSHPEYKKYVTVVIMYYVLFYIQQQYYFVH
jgi:hypothetical protein